MTNVYELLKELNDRDIACHSLASHEKGNHRYGELLAKAAGYKHAGELIRSWAEREGVPIYPHVCAACVYLGFYDERDLYFCPQVSIPTVLARFGPADQDYLSGTGSSDPVLKEAERRAREKGLL